MSPIFKEQLITSASGSTSKSIAAVIACGFNSSTPELKVSFSDLEIVKNSWGHVGNKAIIHPTCIADLPIISVQLMLTGFGGWRHRTIVCLSPLSAASRRILSLESTRGPSLRGSSEIGNVRARLRMLCRIFNWKPRTEGSELDCCGIALLPTPHVTNRSNVNHYCV